MTETRWWWVRHAPVVRHRDRFYGQLDLASDCSDTKAFEALARHLPDNAVLVTSALRRTVETADALEKAGVVWRTTIRDPAMNEQHLGDWQGMRPEDIRLAHGTEHHAPPMIPLHERPPGGESFVDLTARVAPAVLHHSGDHAGSDIVAVTHGGTIRAALGAAAGIAPATMATFTVNNLSLTRLHHTRRDDGSHRWRVICVNTVFPAN